VEPDERFTLTIFPRLWPF